MLCAVALSLVACAAPAQGPVTTRSGLVYQSIKEGSGASPAATDTVKVHYRGTLQDGKEFDSSYKRGQPAEFPLNRVIACWTAIAYGARGAGGVIPPNATLTFEIELLSVKH
jgi:FKBP-type peptidyl-prolyl cis-trans isomerase FkpA